MIRKIALVLLLSTLLFASSKFTLDGVKNIKFSLINRTTFMSSENKKELENFVLNKLKKEKFTLGEIDPINFVIEIKAKEIGETHVLNISLTLTEDVTTNDRIGNPKTFALTYMDNIFIESDFPLEESRSGVDFLMCQFLKAYREDNE